MNKLDEEGAWFIGKLYSLSGAIGAEQSSKNAKSLRERFLIQL